MNYEERLKEKLHLLQLEYRQRAQPIIDELVRLEALKPPQPIVLPVGELPESLQSIVNRPDDEKLSH